MDNISLTVALNSGFLLDGAALLCGVALLTVLIMRTLRRRNNAEESS